MENNLLNKILSKKKEGKKITMLTAYDYAFASIVDETGIDIILVGDSLANVFLGLESTREVGLEEMIYHSKAVRRGVKKTFLIGDMPYNAYQINSKDAVKNAKRFVDEAGCDAVKIEWFDNCLEVIDNVISSGIPVMGHIGLTPQTAEQLGGFKVQGKDVDSAKRLIEQSKELEKKGCFSIVLECLPSPLSKIITNELSIPTIGIGAGPDCDGQVLVIYDLLGLSRKNNPKFVKRYVNLDDLIQEGVNLFKLEVEMGKYPDIMHSYSMKQEEIEKLRNINTF